MKLLYQSEIFFFFYEKNIEAGSSGLIWWLPSWVKLSFPPFQCLASFLRFTSWPNMIANVPAIPPTQQVRRWKNKNIAKILSLIGWAILKRCLENVICIYLHLIGKNINRRLHLVPRKAKKCNLYSKNKYAQVMDICGHWHRRDVG